MHVCADHYRLCLFLCCRWAKNNYSSQGGKPIWVDPQDPRVQHICIDDNIRLTDSDTIVNPQVLLWRSIAPIPPPFFFLNRRFFHGSFTALNYNYNCAVPFCQSWEISYPFRDNTQEALYTKWSLAIVIPPLDSVLKQKSPSPRLPLEYLCLASNLSQRWQRLVSEPPVITAGEWWLAWNSRCSAPVLAACSFCPRCESFPFLPPTHPSLSPATCFLVAQISFAVLSV